MFRKIWLPIALLCAAVLVPRPALADDWNICNNYQDARRAIEVCSRMIYDGRFTPRSWLFSARGVAYRWIGQHNEAIRDFDECIRLDSRNSICWGQRGIAFLLLGDRTQALADLQTAVALDPTNRTAADELYKLRGR
jgi:tetratricopeptide (TPR) repeat protein